LPVALPRPLMTITHSISGLGEIIPQDNPPLSPFKKGGGVGGFPLRKGEAKVDPL
jgi:hypothetical protein